MKTKFALALISFCMIFGSVAAFGQRLYPVQGPAATQSTPPTFTVKKITNYLGKSGIISLVHANGESFQGPWSIVTATFFNGKTPGTPASYPPQPNLAFAWDVVYGQGYYVSTMLGSQQVGQAVVTGDRGTVLQIEFHREQLGVPEDNHFGVAVDNNGNIYKVVL